MDFIQVSAKTVEDAVLEAAMKLATTREHLEYEVIEKGSAGFLGFGAKNAVIKARAIAKKNDIVLLSPACASCDAFKNFMVRGNTFKQIVNEFK